MELNSKIYIFNPKSEIPNPKSKIPNPKSLLPSSLHQHQNGVEHDFEIQGK